MYQKPPGPRKPSGNHNHFRIQASKQYRPFVLPDSSDGMMV